MGCGYMFRGKNRSRKLDVKNEESFYEYSVRKQTLAELSEDNKMSIRTIHRRLTTQFKKEMERNMKLRINPRLSHYTSSVLILDATFFGKKGSDTQWGILVAQDGITGDILASKHIFQETLEDYRILLRRMKQEMISKASFCSDGRS
ncbi:hypothetical protein COW06_04060 [Candidatus Gracilibacteria bacterium CG12_big_fil_rev_8_21_14_0_65_38_15]|nr:MAG: hypothetical protein COW06_04060 [Candidatus Gracilibacteria bacterium CG12_big_fil_rev_8_21_14_0_65_38_15]